MNKRQAKKKLKKIMKAAIFSFELADKMQAVWHIRNWSLWDYGKKNKR